MLSCLQKISYYGASEASGVLSRVHTGFPVRKNSVCRAGTKMLKLSLDVKNVARTGKPESRAGNVILSTISLGTKQSRDLF